MESGRYLLIVNPAAGHRGAKRALYPLLRRLCQGEEAATVYATSAPGEARRVAGKYGAHFSRLICCGGDGTLSEVLGGLLEAGVRTPVGYVPMGTTNDLAHSLGLPRRLSRAIDLAVSGAPQGYDVGLINETRMFDYVACFGAFADTSYATPQGLKNALGWPAYLLFGLTRVFALKPLRLALLADGRRIEGDFYFGSVSNSRRIAGLIDLRQAGVCFDDGLLEVLLIRRPPSAQALRALARGHIDERSFVFLRARELTFRFAAPTPWTLDGERAGPFSQARVRCLPRAMRLVAPAF